MAKNESVAMPMSSAGLIGFSSDYKTGGKQIDSKTLVIAVFAVVILVHVLSFVLSAA